MDVGLIIIWYVVLLISMTCHEAAHAFAALKLGDPTAYYHGQVTLDPVPHIRREPIGMVVIPILSYFLWGWMIGWASAPYDPYWAQRNRKKAALMALAGPTTNLLLVIIAALAIRIGMLLGVFIAPETITFEHVTEAEGPGFLNALAVVVSILFSLNLILFAFNLMPLPPLDGSGMMPLFLKEETALRYQAVMRQPVFSVLGLIVAWNIFDVIFHPIHLFAIHLLYPGMHYS